MPRLHFPRAVYTKVDKPVQALVTLSALLSMATLTLVCVVSLPGRRYDLLPGTRWSGRSTLCAADFNPQLAAVQCSSPSLLDQIKSSSRPILPRHHHHIAIMDCSGLLIHYGSKLEQALSIIKLHLI